MSKLGISHNLMFGSSLDWALLESGSKTPSLEILNADDNHLSGALPSAITRMTLLEWLGLRINRLQGTLPELPPKLMVIELSFNGLAGSIPWSSSSGKLGQCYLSTNKLTGSFPDTLLNAGSLHTLDVSGNALEGTLPEGPISPRLKELNLFGSRTGAAPRLRGPLPPTLHRADMLSITAYNQMLEGAVPALTCTLTTFGMYRNRLTVVPDLRFYPMVHHGRFHSDGSTVLIHLNALSCHLPRFGNISVTFALAALGKPILDTAPWGLSRVGVFHGEGQPAVDLRYTGPCAGDEVCLRCNLLLCGCGWIEAGLLLEGSIKLASRKGSPTMACTCCYAGSLPHDEGHSLGCVSLGGILVALGWAHVPSDVDIGQRMPTRKHSDPPQCRVELVWHACKLPVRTSMAPGTAVVFKYVKSIAGEKVLGMVHQCSHHLLAIGIGSCGPSRQICPRLSGTESAILNRESGDSESCDSNRATP